MIDKNAFANISVVTDKAYQPIGRETSLIPTREFEAIEGAYPVEIDFALS